MAGRKRQGISGVKDVTGGTKRNDRYSETRFLFEPISIDLENVLTVIYMLKSPEDNVVLKAIVSLEKYGKKDAANLEEMSSLGIFEYVVPVVYHGDNLIKRFAIKLIGMLSALEKFRLQLLESDAAVDSMFSILKEEEDVVMHEFSSLTLAHLSSECFAVAKILRIKECADILFVRLTSADPDVQKNCLDTMKNLLNDMDSIKYFTSSSYFNMKPILDLTGSSYPIIQVTSLQVIQQFMAWSTDERVLSAIRDVSGVEVIISIMENSMWPDLHALALDIILKLTDNPMIMEYLLKAGCLQRLVKLLETTVDIECSEKLLGVLARASQTEGGRKVLSANGMNQIFAEYLRKEVGRVQEPACLGIANMGQYPPALESIMSTNPTIYLLDILTNPFSEPKLREMASYAINVLSHKDGRVGDELLRESQFERLLPLLRDSKSLSVETHLNILLILTGISSSQRNRLVIINENLIGSIMDLIQDIDEPRLKPAAVQVGALECLSNLLIEESARKLTEELGGARKVIGCLKNRYASVRQWAALLTIQLSQNINFVRMFIRLNGLKWLIDQKGMRYSAPSWESAIEAIFNAYLPAKFAFTGRLDLQDLTQEGFYILRHQSKLFFILCDLLEIRASPAYPVYVANFETSIRCPSKETVSSQSQSLGKPDAKTDSRERDVHKFASDPGSSDSSISEDYSGSGSGIRSIELENYASCPHDPHLPEYLERLKTQLAKQTNYNFRDPNWLGIHPKLIRQRAQILARFVANEMSGSDPDCACKGHFLDLHLNDIRYELGTNIIPLGHIRSGSYIERALLFKILADRIGLPCALVRGTYGRAWVEIAIPRINIAEEMESKETQTSFPTSLSSPTSSGSVIEERGSSGGEQWEEEEHMEGEKRNICELPCYASKAKAEGYSFPPLRASFSGAFPSRLLKPNAIVDLIQEPGRILPIDSYEADEYRGCFLCLSNAKQMKCK